MNIQQFTDFVIERYRILERRKAGQAWPWTEDKILQTYRFCNVRREDDVVSQWIQQNWIKPNENDKYCWFAALISRFLNLPSTLTDLGYPVPFKPSKLLKVTQKRKDAKLKNFSGAYLITTNSHRGPKVEILSKYVFQPIWRKRDQLLWKPGYTLSQWHEMLMMNDGLGSFLAGQVVADMKFAKPWLKARDWWSFAVSGPGSRRGLNRIIGRDKNARWKEEDWYEAHVDLGFKCAPIFKAAGLPKISGQDLNSCECEWDKYQRVKLGEGRPRQLYKHKDVATHHAKRVEVSNNQLPLI